MVYREPEETALYIIVMLQLICVTWTSAKRLIDSLESIQMSRIDDSNNILPNRNCYCNYTVHISPAD
ncbi:hypothetical protein CEXT_227861 [Caerostris extrusa]|uniref:Uncharacterized protein n=1 Tax=Caerostris extrusa TaxID=172846 RepID=A0AAV4SJM3_CAEEX|nr:hypothetical protein CEXT_227861 [Caerostris extrusa]